MTDSDVLVAPHTIEYTYTRSTGPAIGAFLTGLRDRKIVGVRGSDGRVIVPAVDYDPVTSDGLDEYVEVSDSGVVTTWSWNDSPAEGQPLDLPFAWALVKFDGADTPMLVALDAAGPEIVSTGMRVSARWAEHRTGSIRDLICVEPE
ncbi:MAG TPA: OB-fold domain-containing protein [Mycobacteriales bacterium]|nr:OB-fold domain-containing protein [Mycobacteriales bacterium]